MATVKKQIRSALDHLCLIKAHLQSLKKNQNDIEQLGHSPAGIVTLRRSMLDVRMVVEELMLLSVSAHETAGREVTQTLRSEPRADKKMAKIRELNSNFFPVAIDIVETDEVDIAGQFISPQDPYLTDERAKEFYRESGNILHASWRFMDNKTFNENVDRLSEFYRLTERLLITFEIDISGSGSMILGHLNLNRDALPQVFEGRIGGIEAEKASVTPNLKG